MDSGDSGKDEFHDKLGAHPEVYDAESANGHQNNDNIPKIKRTACILCRKRKLKCDGAKPKCGTCGRLGHECKYDEVRKKSGPKRGYVKALEARLAQVETMLKDGPETNTTTTTNQQQSKPSPPRSNSDTTMFADAGNFVFNSDAAAASADMSYITGTTSGPKAPQPVPPQASTTASGPFEGSFSWEMVSLGLEEPLPEPHVMKELYDAYFAKVHPSLPIIHKARFHAALDLAPHLRPPVALRYSMWTLAAGMLDKYTTLTEHFYRRARKYLELDEMRGHGEATITLSHCQAWLLTTVHEFKNMYFPRAWMSTGRAVRLAQMMGLHRLDGVGLDVKQCLPVPNDWTEREERRRTFWLAFWEDRCASIGTGWPMTIDEGDILTNLPASEEAFQNGKPEKTYALPESLECKQTDCGQCVVSSFAGIVILSCLFGRNLIHLHRPDPDDRDGDLNGRFWERHRNIDGILLSISLNLPEHLRVPTGLPDPNVIFLNMCIHTSVICLHQAAIFKAEKNQMPEAIAGGSKVRCITAAIEIASIMRSVAHLDLSPMNPFMAFCLYVAARVFVQFLKARREDQQISYSLHFLMAAMHAIKRKNPLTESFLAQLEVDMETAGMPVPKARSVFTSAEDRPIPEYLKHQKEYVSKPTGLKGHPVNYESISRKATGSESTPQTSLPLRDRLPNSPMASFGTENGQGECTLPGLLPYGPQSQAQPQQQQTTPTQQMHNGQQQQQQSHQQMAFGFPDLQGPTLTVPDGSSDGMRQNSLTDEMDLSPNNSSSNYTGGTASSCHSQRANSAHHSPFTPPEMDGTSGNQNSTQSELSGGKFWQATAAESTSSYAMTNLGPNGVDFTHATVGLSGEGSYHNLQTQFFPPTPGMESAFMAEFDLQGMTPGMGMTEDWNQIMEGIGGNSWDNTWTNKGI